MTIPPSAAIVSVEVVEDSSSVTIWTCTPGIVIGRRGDTADRIRTSLSASIGRPVQIFIHETKDPPENPPSVGVREPRTPNPMAPVTAVVVEVD